MNFELPSNCGHGSTRVDLRLSILNLLVVSLWFGPKLAPTLPAACWLRSVCSMIRLKLRYPSHNGYNHLASGAGVSATIFQSPAWAL